MTKQLSAVRNVDSNGGSIVPNIVLQTEELAKSYGSLVAVKDLTLEVYEDKVFGFLRSDGHFRLDARQPNRVAFGN